MTFFCDTEIRYRLIIFSVGFYNQDHIKDTQIQVFLRNSAPAILELYNGTFGTGKSITLVK